MHSEKKKRGVGVLHKRTGRLAILSGELRCARVGFGNADVGFTNLAFRQLLSVKMWFIPGSGKRGGPPCDVDCLGDRQRGFSVEWHSNARVVLDYLGPWSLEWPRVSLSRLMDGL